tara:strand:+ start:4366 stop:5520 length:1155 start_codon:yes stop_codon:yes gene_type:complete
MSAIYLDNQSTTQIDPQVLESMLPWLKDKFGNPESRNHYYGWEASDAIELAREEISKLIGSDSKEIIFTSGATESNNLAIQGVANGLKQKGNHIITVKTEHKAVLDVCKFLENKGYLITYLNVKSDGSIDLEQLINKISFNTILVSIMHVNNEIGIIHPIKLIGDICKSKNVPFHVDATQSVGKIILNMNELNIDLMSFSSHKIYGPKGIGALYRKKNSNINLEPLIYGGKHENGMRAGTLPVHNIIGFGKACNICLDVIDRETTRILELRNYMIKCLMNENNEIKLNGNLKNRIAGNINLLIPGISNESLIMNTPNLAFSTGAACTTSSIAPSHVLSAIGLTKEESFSSVRFGIGRFNTKNDIDISINHLNQSINKLKTNILK